MKIGVIGGGAWGTALASVAAAGGEDVLLWALESEVVEAVNAAHINTIYLANIALPPSVRATINLADMAQCDALLVVTPAQHLRSSLAQLPPSTQPLILCSKGIEAGTMKLMSEVAADAHPGSSIAVLSGPTFAHEVAKGLPTAITLACEDTDLGDRLGQRLAQPWFRPYASQDVVGAEIGGAVKNVLAIACGVAEGLALGQNARAALIARGFAEMRRFGLARGAERETLSGLSGLGDLVLTCSSVASRNFSLGLGLGQGQNAATLLADRRTVAEGAFTAPVLAEAARKTGVDMPIVDTVCALLAGEVDAKTAVGAILARPLREESA